MATDDAGSGAVRLFTAGAGLILLSGWILFCTGLSIEYWLDRGPGAGPWRIVLLCAASAAAAFVFAFLWFSRQRWSGSLNAFLLRRTEDFDCRTSSHTAMWVFVAAGTGLFLELAFVRYHSSVFQLFAYFKNVSLLSCFLGLGIGYAMGRRGPVLMPLALPLLCFQMVLMHALRQTGAGFYLQNPVTEQLGLGINQASGVAYFAASYGFLTFAFAFNALCFIPLGQAASRLMTRLPKLVAYSWNLAGSLMGIVVFTALSFLCLPPAVWIAIAAVGLIGLAAGSMRDRAAMAAAVVLTVACLGISAHKGFSDIYSPYQVLTLIQRPGEKPVVRVNNVYFQQIVDLRRPGPSAVGAAEMVRNIHYDLPFVFKDSPADVLVVGSGTGNDVAAALRAGAGSVDAVEIDPVIVKLGKKLHPERPYFAPGVRTFINDARAFFRSSRKKYDIIVFGLLDSHTLLSGMASVRLDSYIYTVEAFRDARARLKDDGILSLSFSLLSDQMGRKIYLMLSEAFDGGEPAVYRTGHDGGYAFVIARDGRQPAADSLYGAENAAAVVTAAGLRADVSTDDWPFLYMPVRKYPVSYVALIAVLLAVSLAFIRKYSPLTGRDFPFPCFFLGAGFMLVETKAITELALMYGNTWMVVSVVLVAICLLGFFANLAVMKGAPASWSGLGYILLLCTLAAGLFVPLRAFSGMAQQEAAIMMTVLLTMPLFFSGGLFSFELTGSASVASALSANLLGAMLGGFLEYNAMYFGYRFLYVLAIVLYLAAFVSSSIHNRRRALTSTGT